MADLKLGTWAKVLRIIDSVGEIVIIIVVGVAIPARRLLLQTLVRGGIDCHNKKICD